MNPSVIQWNCRGYSGNFEEIKSLLMNENGPSCLCLQETFHGNRQPLPPKGYKILYGNPILNYQPNVRPSRGLITLIKHEIPYYPISINTNLEYLAIRIKLRREYTICNIYISPTEDISKQQLLNLMNQLPRPFILIGDLNARHEAWGDSTNNTHGRVIQDLLLSSEFYLLNENQPTHLHIQTGTLSYIDLAIVSPDISNVFKWSRIDDLYNSDHFPISLTEIIITPDTTNTSNPKFKLKQANWSNFYNATDVTEDLINSDEDINSLVAKFNNIIKMASDLTIPTTNPDNKKYPVPWWNQECTRVQQDRKKARRKYQRSKSLADKISLNKASAISRRTLRQARKQSWQDYVSTVNSDTPINKIWKKINKISGKFSGNRTPCINNNGTMIMDHHDVANILGSHIAHVSSNNYHGQEFNNIRAQTESVPLNFQSSNNESYNCQISIAEFKSSLQKCTDTAPGNDNIHYMMIKKLHPSARSFLINIYNRIFIENTLPDEWKESILIPILKPNKPESSVNSYRPIALTSSICKLLEKNLNARLVYHLEFNNLFSESQYGFRKNRSTVDLLAKIQTDIYNSFTNKNHLIAVFFDIEKAYDTTWRRHILQMVHDADIRGHLAYFIKNFLSSRFFYVRVGSSMSNRFIQQQGVPQGSVLSVTMFGLAINNIVKDLPNDIQKGIFVDDLSIHYSSSSVQSIQRKLQLSIDKIYRWTRQVGFKLSTEKTVAVHFHRKRGLQTEADLSINGNRIPFKTSAKYLGMIFDQRLYWKTHIDYLRSKCMKSLNLLKCLSHQGWGADRKSLLRIYRATTRSQLDYGSQIYASAPDHVLKRLDAIHNLGIRLCTGAFKSSPITSLMADAGERHLSSRRNQLCLQMFIRMQRIPESLSASTVFASTLSNRYIDNVHSRPFGLYCEIIMRDLNLNQSNTLPYSPPSEPPWKIPAGIVCEHRLQKRKRDYPPIMARQLITEHHISCHRNSIHIYTDGSKSGENAGYGVFSNNFSSSHKLPNTASSYTAEAYAVLNSMHHIEQNSQSSFTIFSDSLSLLQALEQTNSNNPIIIEIQSNIIKLYRLQKNITFCWVPSHIDIPGNEEADKLAKNALTSNTLSNFTSVPHNDHYPKIKSQIWEKWQSTWHNISPLSNKLRSIKNTVKPWQSSCITKSRHAEILLCRLRIGHTRFTHGHLMEGRRTNDCPSCDEEPLTIEHILSTCPDYNEDRMSCFNNRHPSVKDLLCETNISFTLNPIFRFLTITNLIDKL